MMILLDFEANESEIQRLREKNAELEQHNELLQMQLDEFKRLPEILPICSYCKDVRDADNRWHKIENYLLMRLKLRFSHTICAACYQVHCRTAISRNG